MNDATNDDEIPSSRIRLPYWDDSDDSQDKPPSRKNKSVITIGSQKGGSGKTTLSTNLAAALSANHDVMLVDADRQGNATNWFNDRSENDELPQVHSVKQYGDLRKTIADLARRYEIVIIDTAGKDSHELRSAMLCSNLLIMPLEASQFALDTVPRMVDIYEESLLTNPGLKFKVVISMGPTNPIIHEVKDARAFYQNFPVIEVLKTTMSYRKVYRDSVHGGIGKGVVEMDNAKAKREILHIIQEIF